MSSSAKLRLEMLLPPAEVHKAERPISGARFANESRFNAWEGLKVDAASLRAGGEAAEKGVYLR
jgi:hypothetical protein